ncbi:hypothetical protein H5410_055684 [Solanum commersonii]|uniref:Uncharacterized protein n=1 Tax=Solanum commersonii TaxID=4109 RepID=A0A9J5WKY5_SOLCO|nr:hypothetical protein H5410_055684 [Solanum commersonii]
MTSPSENLNLAIIPYEYQESLFILPDVMLINTFGVTHLAYALIEDALIQGEDENQSMVTDKLDSHYKGKQESLKVTRAVQRDLDATLLTRSTKKTHGQKSKFVPPENPIDVPDDITVTKKNGKRKRTASKEHVTLSKSVRKSKYTDDSDGDMVVSTKTRKARILAFKKRKVIRGRVVTGIGGHEIGELLLLLQAQGWATLFLQGNGQRKMGRKETREFYTNSIGSASLISSNVMGASFTLDAEVLSQILGVPNVGWGHYVKQVWLPLEGLPSALEISRRFAHDLMIEGICVHDDKDHGLGYGFWLGKGFEYFRVLVKEWQEQTTKDVLGEVDHVVIPATSRGANDLVQRLKTLLTTKDEEIAALRTAHSAAMDQLHISYGLEHAGLVEENYRLKDELAKTQAALETE